MNALNYLLSKTTPSPAPSATAEASAYAAPSSTASPAPSASPAPPSPSSRASASLRMPPSSAWSPPRAKIQLKLSIQRIRLLATKKSQLAKVTRRDIASLLERGKVEAARIRCEGVMGEDRMVELLEVLELYCEVCLSRFGLLETVNGIDPGVSEAAIGIIHAAPRTELKELHLLREMLMSKGGRDFAIAAVDNTNDCVPKRVSEKLVVAQPPTELVDLYLYEIAKAYSVGWRPEGFPDPSATPVPTAPDLAAHASDAPATQEAGLAPSAASPHPAALTPLPDTPAVEPKEAPNTVVITTSLPSPRKTPAAPIVPAVGGADSEKKKEQDAFDALTKRFAELKKR